ncbi:ketoacyl-synthetase C-terminal extension domain-containing protein, partial [Microbispora sp. KK1-11]|uniref:ketoacyl-synthetase C-terminal extension domain-containing protein n=1 Tax=Microbispora sp. KK1-11 TaxID=2053005 RepID=UPI00116CD550
VHAIRNAVLPQTLHIDEPTPHVDWTTGTIRLLTEQRPWPQTGHPRRAAVSAFGVSGTNAHVIIEQAPDQDDAAPEHDTSGTPQASAAVTPRAEGSVPVVPWVISARSRDALTAQAARLAHHLDRHPELDPVDVGYSLATTRTRFDHR